MQNRRQFLCTAIKGATGATVTLLLTPLLGCKSENETTTPTPAPATTVNPTTPACDGAGATSTYVLNHSHTVCVPLADINAPPAAGMTYTTSSASSDLVTSHNHQVSLTQAQLMSLAAGQTIVMTTSVSQSHTHDFSLVENGPSTTAPAPTVTPTPTPTPTPSPY
jgi:hypothetical protein